MIIFTFYNNVHVHEFGNYPLPTKYLMPLIIHLKVLAITTKHFIMENNKILSLGFHFTCNHLTLINLNRSEKHCTFANYSVFRV